MIKDLQSLFEEGDEGMTEGGFIPVITEGDDNFELKEEDTVNVPIIPLRNVVLFPGVLLPVSMGRKKSLQAVKYAYKNKMLIATFLQKDAKVEEPMFDDLSPVGTIAQVVKILELPDGSTTALLQGRKRISLQSIDSVKPFYRGTIAELADEMPSTKEEKKEFNALLEAIRETSYKIIKGAGNLPPEAMFAIKNIENPASFINFACSNLGLECSDKQTLLQLSHLRERGYFLLDRLNKQLQLLELKLSIQNKTHEGMNRQQREYFLQQQIKTIQDELGDSQSKFIDELRLKAEKKKWSAKVKETFEHELAKLDRMAQHSPDYSVQLSYLETIVSLPWDECTKDSLNLRNVRKVLDRDHFGMEKVKERILEHLSVLKLKQDLKSPIICLVGAPGVGKTSLCRSIADALNRKYVRVSLGGLHDEAEIRGHRRTYIGAMPGRIIQSIQKAGASNPVFVLDEIDKVNRDIKGDPESALLEVLDPEQNSAFHDNFLDIDYDLSKVMFIATANSLSTISQPLLDRMEIIDVSGYITEEKVRIGIDHLIPKEQANHGILPEQITITPNAVELIVEGYTRESGVRELDKQICKIMRKLASKIATKEEYDVKVDTKESVEHYLGKQKYFRDKYQNNDYAGVVTGLAWTSVGGEILFVETSLCKSKAPKLTLTGQLGDVMKESAMIALQYVRCHSSLWNISEDLFEENSIHVHVPEGAVPKDGPSAGITMVTSLVSALTKRKVRKNLAMTGEITLRGMVLPVGGIREKILAAKRAGISDIIMCKDNERDILEIKPEYLKGLHFHYVEDIRQVIDYALLDEVADK